MLSLCYANAVSDLRRVNFCKCSVKTTTPWRRSTARTSDLGGAGTAAGVSTPAPGPLPSSRGQPLRYAVVKRALPSSVLALQLRVMHGILQSVLELVSPPRGHRHPRNPSVSPCFMRSALLMYRRRPFPIASASAMAAGELTSGNTIRTSLTFLSPSQGLADTEFRNMRSTRSVTSRRLTVRTLCMSLSLYVASRVRSTRRIRNNED